MASFTDKAPSFNPYVQQLPVEAMAMVGMQKQQQYDTNVQKITDHIQKIGGLDVLRDVDKTYLQSKLNELGNNLRNFAASDFSNFQLTNSTLGMVSNVAKDKHVLNAVNSTAKYRKELEYMEEARKKGELTPQNKYDFDLEANQWLSSSELDDSFSGVYKPFFDKVKHVRDIINDMKPDGKTFDELYTIDEKTGNPVLSPTMRRLSEKGLLPAKVRQAIDYAFSDPRVQQQSRIDGKYFYKDQDVEVLHGRLSQLKEDTMGSLVREEEDIKAKIQAGLATQEQLQAVQDAMESAGKNFDAHLESVETNPNKIREILYTQTEKARLTNMFSWKETSTTYHENPEWVWNYKRMRDDISDQQWKAGHGIKEEELQLRKDTLQWQKDKFGMEQAIKAGEGGGGNSMNDVTELQLPTTYSKYEAAIASQKQAKEGYSSAVYDLLDIGIIKIDPKLENEFISLRAQGVSEQDAQQQIILQYIKTKRADSTERDILTMAEEVIKNPNASLLERERASEQMANIIAKHQSGILATIINNNVVQDSNIVVVDELTGELNTQAAGLKLDMGNADLVKSINNFVDTKNALKRSERIEKEIEDVKQLNFDRTGITAILENYSDLVIPARSVGNYKDVPNTLDINAEDILMFEFYSTYKLNNIFRGKETVLVDKILGQKAEAHFKSKYGPNFEEIVDRYYNKPQDVRAQTAIRKVMGEFSSAISSSNSKKNMAESLEAVYDKNYSVPTSVSINIQPPTSMKNAEFETKRRFEHILNLVKNQEGKNESGTFKDFAKNAEKAKGLTGFDVAIRVKEDGTPVHYVRDAAGNEMKIESKDASALGVNYGELLLEPRIKYIQAVLDDKGYTSSSDPNHIDTYKNRDYIFGNDDLPAISNTLGGNSGNRFLVGVNFKKNPDGRVVPSIFIQDYAAPEGYQNHVLLNNYNLNAADLPNVIQTLRTLITPAFLERIMRNDYETQFQKALKRQTLKQ